MNIFEFSKKFNSEEVCKAHFLSTRIKEGVFCRKCQSITPQAWMEGSEKFRCLECKTQTTLTSGTLLENSKLGFRVWYMCMYFMTFMVKPTPAREMCRQLGIRRYQTVWAMMHKIRVLMGKREALRKLQWVVEMDEAFIATVPEPGKEKKAGRGTDKASIAVMCEQIEYSSIKDRKEKTKPGYIRLTVIDDFSHETLKDVAKKEIETDATVLTDGHKSYEKFSEIFEGHIQKVSPKELAHKNLPWVHTNIANLKGNLEGIYHSIKEHHLQKYLDEYSFKFNHRFRRP